MQRSCPQSPWPKCLNTRNTHLEIQKIIKRSLQCLSLNDFSQEKWLCHIKNRKLHSRKKGKRKLTGVLASCLLLKPTSGCQKWNKEETGKRKPLFTLFLSPRKVGLQSVLAGTWFFSSTVQRKQMLTLWALFLSKWNLCQACADFFLAHLVLWWFAMNFGVHQEQSSDTVQFWCQLSPGLALPSHGTVVSLLYFELKLFFLIFVGT